MARFVGRVAVLVAAAAVIAAGVELEAEIRPWGAKPTPRLASKYLDGSAVDLQEFRGRVVLVNFWATWCEPCRDEMPALERLRLRLQGKPFEVLAVNYGESSAKITDFLGRQRVSLPVVLDPDKEAADAWNAKGLPMTFIVDAKGSVRYFTFGERDWSAGEGLKLVEKLVAEAAGAR